MLIDVFDWTHSALWLVKCKITSPQEEIKPSDWFVTLGRLLGGGGEAQPCSERGCQADRTLPRRPQHQSYTPDFRLPKKRNTLRGPNRAF